LKKLIKKPYLLETYSVERKLTPNMFANQVSHPTEDGLNRKPAIGGGLKSQKKKQKKRTTRPAAFCFFDKDKVHALFLDFVH